MKKITVIAVMMAVLAVAVPLERVYSQNLTLSGYLNSGLGLVSVEGEDDSQFKIFGADSEQSGYRFRLNGAYNNEARTAGIRFRFQSQTTLGYRSNLTDSDGDTVSATNNVGFLSIPYVYGYVSFFENKLNLSGGIIDDGTWQTSDWYINDDPGEGLGLLIKAAPVEGLNLGAGIYLISQLGSGDNSILSNYSLQPSFRNTNLNVEDTKYVISASYTLKDAFYLGASYRTENKAGWGQNRQETSQIMGDFRFLGLKDLTAIIAFDLDVLEDFADNGTIKISETFSYAINDEFTLGLDAVQFLFNSDRDPGFLFHLWGSYAIGDMVPRIDLTYFIEGRGNSRNEWHRKGYDAAADWSVFGIRPSIRINVDSRTFLEIGDVFNYNIDKPSGQPDFTNAFYIDFRWNF